MDQIEKMVKKYTFYIGADNRTGQVDLPAIVESVSKTYGNGFTLIPGIGIWEGHKESMAVVTVLVDFKLRSTDDDLTAQRAANRLALELKQECVLLEISEVNDIYYGGEAYGKKD